jgi:hypothetical protein
LAAKNCEREREAQQGQICRWHATTIHAVPPFLRRELSKSVV